MEISSKDFNLDESTQLTIDSNDNDGLINVPTELQIKCDVTNNYGKILINRSK